MKREDNSVIELDMPTPIAYHSSVIVSNIVDPSFGARIYNTSNLNTYKKFVKKELQVYSSRINEKYIVVYVAEKISLDQKFWILILDRACANL
jgi:hypothetical protein